MHKILWNSVAILILILGLDSDAAEGRAQFRAVTIYYMDPWSNSGLPLSVDALVKAVEARELGTAKIHIDGNWPLLEIVERLPKQWAQVPAAYWLHDSLDARIVVRFWKDETTFIQMCVQSAEKAEWNNILSPTATAEEIRIVLGLLPKPLFDCVYDAQYAAKRIEKAMER